MPDKSIHDETKNFDSFIDAEKHLESIGATYWEIGIPCADVRKEA